MINEGQADIALSYLFKCSAKEDYTAVRTIGDDNDDGWVTCWPETFQYMLRTYETSGSIREEILTMSDTRGNEKESERAFETRLF